jgi:hypothetical protein
MFLTEGAVYHQEYSGGERCYFLVTGRFKNGNYKGLVTDGRKKPVKTSAAHPPIPYWIETPADEIPKTLR